MLITIKPKTETMEKIMKFEENENKSFLKLFHFHVHNGLQLSSFLLDYHNRLNTQSSSDS